MSNEHDIRYRKLFSNPVIMRELLVSFVHEPWVDQLDFSAAERLDRTFVSESFNERESDLIWKLKFKGEDIYLYLLIEFQSSVDRFMALRVLCYLTEFYQFLVDSKTLANHRRLPTNASAPTLFRLFAISNWPKMKSPRKPWKTSAI